MAKSLRSKRERKLRKIKRVRYGKKELIRLKNMLGITDHPKDVEMKNLEEHAIVKTANDIKMSAKQKHIMEEIKKMNEVVADLEDGTGRLKNLGSVSTFIDDKGNYPDWMSKRKIKKLKINQKRDKKREKTKRKKELQVSAKTKKLNKIKKLKAKDKVRKAKEISK